ncbi:MAG TPA: NAD(P)-binding domain-containing protein [Thermoanaerobaculia bacterium]|nr:NAD(P)-binding domain-containing protein [Thermoanaerobaculia bacterium]
MQKIRVGVLGSGDVGRVRATGFLNLGHDVKIGTREPAKLAEWASAAGARASVGSFEEAARFGDIIVLATLGTGTESAIGLAGTANFDGKVLIDATNPLDFSTGAPKLSIAGNDSLGEHVQRLVPKARVVKAFNTVGNALMINPQLPGGPPDMFLCGNDADAKKIVSQICEHFGWGVIDLGGIESSRYLEPMCMVWVLHGVASKSWTHAFKMLRAK